jgi:zinc-dependent metalloproteinase lipoprotein
MKNSTLITLVAGLIAFTSSSSFGQVISHKSNTRKCATMELLSEARKNNPNIESDAHFEAWLQNLIQQRAQMRTATAYTLPIVFHVINNGETEGTGLNLAQGYINSQLNQLNKDFGNRSNSPYAVAATTDIQFAMAQKDPSGVTLTQPGIDRVNRNTKGWTAPGTGWSTSYIISTIKPGSIWDPTKYVNIWLLPISGGTLGFATFPASSTLNGLDNSETNSTAGVVIGTEFVGSIINPSSNDCSVNAYNLGRTMTHELGHFFGLRHIWGDSEPACGTDYVGDTPASSDANYGIPSHPKVNTVCGTADEMFENYMDYTDDIAMNTFTAGQAARMQTVMVNSPRRSTLPTSTAGLVAVPSNKIGFMPCVNSITVSEKATTASFPWYRDIAVVVNVEDKATAAATLTVTTSGTATSGIDFQILNPSISVAAGDAFKIINLRIIDDGVPESTETITIGYTISGTGLTAGALNQTYSVTITDDDNVRPGENAITLLSQDFGTSGNALPVGWGSYTNGGPNSFVVSTNGNAGGTGQAAHVTSNTTNKVNSYTKTASSLAVLRTPLIDAAGMSNVRLQYKYRVAGESYGPGDHYDFGFAVSATQAAGTNFNPVSTDTLAAVITTGNPTPAPISGTRLNSLDATFNDNKFYLGFWWENDGADGNDPGFNVDDVVVTADGTRIETAVNATNSLAVTPSTINHFRSTANSKLIATVTNTSTSISQLTASILEAGNDRPTIATQTGTYLRSRKVFQLNPSVADNTTSYTATFYFTPTEVAAWGTNINTVKILKLNNSANLSGTLSSADGVIVTPTIVDKLTTDGYISFTATFTGFSKFVIVEAATVLPVRLLDFTGALSGSKVVLNWKTTAETNNKGFDVERSTDGSTFSKIGWVDAGNSPLVNKYSFDDLNLSKGNRYYYRLKQFDIDNHFSYSPVINIVYVGKQSFTWYPNPVKNVLSIQNNGVAKDAVVVITDITGRVMYKSQALLSGKLEVSTASWSKGVYTVQLTADGTPVTFKVVKD